MHHVLITFSPRWYGLVLMDADIERMSKAVKVTKAELWGKGEDELIAALNETGADIHMTCWGSPITTPKVMKAAPHYKYLVHAAGGLRSQISREAMEAGFLVTNWGNVTSRSTAEGAFAMTFALLRNYEFMVDWTRRDRLYWETPRRDEGLFNQRVGLHGLGAIAQEYAKFLQPFGCKVSAYSPHVPDSVFAELGIRRAKSLEELYSSNRIISCHAADVPANRRIVTAKLLAMIEDGGYFINTARGGVVETEALIAELKSGRLIAALDVFDEEPLPAESILRDLPNCFAIPHRAGPTPDRRRDMGAHAVDNVLAYAAGKPVDGIVDVKKYDLMT
jgi:phosphoglycerate dehydrogenase-like enzyme